MAKQKRMSTEMIEPAPKLPSSLHALFWDFDIDAIDLRRHAQLIIERIMERGAWAAMQWLQANYSRDSLRAFLEQRGKRVLPPRELNYWSLLCGVPSHTRREWLTRQRDLKSIWTSRHAS